MFIARLINAPEVYAPLALIVIFSICAHELMHAWTALKQGDDTAARLGHPVAAVRDASEPRQNELAAVADWYCREWTEFPLEIFA